MKPKKKLRLELAGHWSVHVPSRVGALGEGVPDGFKMNEV